jgi:hypothetical protein
MIIIPFITGTPFTSNSYNKKKKKNNQSKGINRIHVNYVKKKKKKRKSENNN